MSIKKLLIFFFVLASAFFSLEAQIGHGGFPYTFSNDLSVKVPTEIFPVVDRSEMFAIDEEFYMEKSKSTRFGKEQPVSLGLENAGVWTDLENGDRVWQLKIKCPSAYHINLEYDQFLLPSGGLFYVYSADKKHVLGAFTDGNNKSYGRFSTGIVPGSISVLEYYEPAEVRGRGLINIKTVVHGYRNLLPKSEGGFGDSGSCNINVNCPEGDDWQFQKRGVLRIIDGGFDWCSGSLINNTSEDCSPYFLSANHCDGDIDSWVFYFNWETPGCENVVEEIPLDQSVSGGNLLSSSFDVDGLLLELSASPPEDYHAYWAGWDIGGAVASRTVGIHHPAGDVKKISINNDETISDSFFPDGPPNTHWIVDNWERGVTEGGSSGSPLYDTNNRIIGFLSGGLADCLDILQSDFYGKMSYYWDTGSVQSQRLEEWLDPIGSGVRFMDGKFCSDFVATSGIDETELSLAVYPNPAQGLLNFNIPNENSLETDIVIRDLSGRVLYRTNTVSQSYQWEIPSELANGFYFASIVQGKQEGRVKFAVLR